MNASIPITLNNSKSAGGVFLPPRWLFFGRAPLPVSSERIHALITDMDSQRANSIQALTELKEECRHG